MVAFDHADADLVRAGLAGVDGLLFVSAHEGPARLAHHRTVVEAAARAGVGHVVHTGYVGASDRSTFTLARDHAATERMLADAGLGCTILRDNMHIDFAEHLVGPDGIIRGPAGAGRVAMVARADIAEVAATCLLHPAEHIGRTHDMTGPEALGLGDVAALLGRALGRPVAYHDETVDEAHRSRAHFGAPDGEVEAWVTTYEAISAGELSRVSDDVEHVTGHPPLSLTQYLRLAGTPSRTTPGATPWSGGGGPPSPVDVRHAPMTSSTGHANRGVVHSTATR